MIYCIYQEGIHPKATINIVDQEDLILFCQAYLGEKDFVKLTGKRVEILSQNLIIFDLTNAFSSLQEAEFNYIKEQGFFQPKQIKNSLFLKGKDVTKQSLQSLKKTSRTQPKIKMQTNGKIFISHSSKDLESVKLFVDQILKLGFEINASDIFCSSMKGHGIRNGEYIPSIIKAELQSSSLVLLFISDNYRESEVCLNELGGAWVYFEDNNVIPLLLPDSNFDSLGFLKQNHLGTKLNDEDCLDTLLNDIKEVLNLNPNSALLNEHKKEFFNIISGSVKKNKNSEKASLKNDNPPTSISLRPKLNKNSELAAIFSGGIIKLPLINNREDAYDVICTPNLDHSSQAIVRSFTLGQWLNQESHTIEIEVANDNRQASYDFLIEYKDEDGNKYQQRVIGANLSFTVCKVECL